jgi:hypothetical protein
MSKFDVVKSSFLSGVLDPRASARVETQAYADGMVIGDNILVHHLGGVFRRWGSKFLGFAPFQLEPQTPATVTAPNGGNTAYASDYLTFTTFTTTVPVGTTNPYVVVEYDLGFTTPFATGVFYADVWNIRCSGGSAVEFAVQYSTDNVNWTTAGLPLQSVNAVDGVNYRRMGPVNARYWRIARVGSGALATMGSATISLTGFNILWESQTLSQAKAFGFEPSTTEQYVLVVSDRSGCIYDANDNLVEQVPLPYLSADVSLLSVDYNVETLAIVHENYAPLLVIRQTPTWFRQILQPITGYPMVDYNDSLSPTPTSDIQTITFTSGWADGDQFQVVLETDKSDAIAYSADPTTLSNNIAAAVQNMWVIDGFTGVSCSSTGTGQYQITCAGEAADTYDNMTVLPLSSSSSASVVHNQVGVPRKEPAFSPTRGYPRLVRFFQGRMYYGGLKSKITSLLGSEVNNLQNFALAQGLDDDPVFVTLNGRALDAISGIYPGRSLQIFTSGGEYRYLNDSGEPVTPTSAPANQTQYGSAQIPPVGIDGDTLYVTRNRKSIRNFRYTYTELAYNSLGISALCPHLIFDVQEMAAYNGAVVDDMNLVFVVNGTNDPTNYGWDNAIAPDGTLAVLTTRKEANVQAWTSWTTQGQYKSTAVVLQSAYFIVQRVIGGVTRMCIERADASYYTDCATKFSFSTPTQTLTGLDYLDGTACQVIADGSALGLMTVAGGSITLPNPASNVEIGIGFNPTIAPMPLQTATQRGSNLMKKRRIVKVLMQVRNTLGLVVNGNIVPDTHVDQTNFDTAPVPYTGVVMLDDSCEWDQDKEKIVNITQTLPYPLEILAIDVEMAGGA